MSAPPEVPADASAPFSLILPAGPPGQRLDQALALALPQFSRSRLKSWIDDGLVLVDSETCEPKSKVYGGEEVEVTPPPDPSSGAFTPEAMALEIVHEDAQMLVVNKPAGLVVHPGAGNWSGTLLNGLLHHAPKLAGVPRAGIVHRLDKDTTGLMVVAKTVTAQTELVRQLQARSVKREYCAVASGKMLSDGMVDAPIGRHPKDRVRMAVVAEDRGGKSAVTHYTVEERFASASMLRCSLETGRTHQIRVHMAHLGHALLGDSTYASRAAAARFTRQALHAARLTVNHPKTKKPVTWEAALPADFAALLVQLRQTK